MVPVASYRFDDDETTTPSFSSFPISHNYRSKGERAQHVPRIPGRPFKAHLSPLMQPRVAQPALRPMYLQTFNAPNNNCKRFGAVSQFNASRNYGCRPMLGKIGVLNTHSLLMNNSDADMRGKMMGSLAILPQPGAQPSPSKCHSELDAPELIKPLAILRKPDTELVSQAEQLGVATEPPVSKLASLTASELQSLDAIEVRCAGIGRVTFHTDMPRQVQNLLSDVTFSRDKVTGVPAVIIQGAFEYLSATIVLEHVARHKNTGGEIMCDRKRKRYETMVNQLSQTLSYDVRTNELTMAHKPH